MAEPRKTARCAIYTRKSTEHNLDLEFNSLDAQREACEAYIKSQAHEGWRLVPGQFDDGGISGGSLDRPALQALLSEIQAGKVDIVVVYKVDRLTRSLTDFAKLVDLFDRHGVSFVSITQAFNTTTSMGRLTLNVLLSFAQFEREVIGERVRDKIAASKRKGLWMGGPVPLGYAAKNKKLVVVPDEAETVRLIFQRYLELGSLQALAVELDRLGIRTKERAWSDDRTVGGVRFQTGPLAHLLKNRCYIGEVVHQGKIFQGDHDPIINRDMFDVVQERFKYGAVNRILKLRSNPAALVGKIYDDQGNRMTPSHTLKKRVRYRYYVSQAVLQKGTAKPGSVTRVPAVEIETLVADALRNDHDVTEGTAQLDRVVITTDAIEMHINAAADDQDTDTASKVISLPWLRPSFVAPKGIAHEPPSDSKVGPRHELLAAAARARSWLEELTEDGMTIAEIARLESRGERHIRLLLPLAFLAPALVEVWASGSAPSALTITGLAQSIPNSWASQSKKFRYPKC
jgi:site-specific DNA recombinase